MIEDAELYELSGNEDDRLRPIVWSHVILTSDSKLLKLFIWDFVHSINIFHF